MAEYGLLILRKLSACVALRRGSYNLLKLPSKVTLIGIPTPYSAITPAKVCVAGGRWNGSMGEGLMLGFDAIGATTVGSELAHLLGALSDDTIDGSAATVAIGTEELFTVTGLPRAAYHPQFYLARTERDETHDPVLVAIGR